MKTVNDFIQMKKKSEKVSMVTCYDYSTALIVNKSNVDIILVGDSLGMVFSGYENTIPVTIDEMIYHTKAVRRGAPDKFIVADLPFLSYHVSNEDTLLNTGRLFKESGCNAVKLEGGAVFAEKVRLLSEASIPVIGHLGLTPQSVHKFGGFKVQGREKDAALAMIEDAKILQEAGAVSIVLEMIPADLAKKISSSVDIPIIGIGAGVDVDGQVLVINDILGYNTDFNPKFLKKYRNFGEEILNALNEYTEDVSQKSFPGEEHSFK